MTRKAWEGRMSERKADYYAQHLANQIVGQVEDTVETVQPIEQPTGLPTLLARMVNEYAWELDPLTFSQETVEQFSTILLSAAQPLLTEYLTAITTPPLLVVKEQQDDEASLPMMARAVLAAERQRAEEALALVRAGKGVSAARKHLGLE